MNPTMVTDISPNWPVRACLSERAKLCGRTLCQSRDLREKWRDMLIFQESHHWQSPGHVCYWAHSRILTVFGYLQIILSLDLFICCIFSILFLKSSLNLH